MSEIKRGPKPRPWAERFWEKVDRSAGASACWPWLGSYFTRNGKKRYGRFMRAREDGVGAHRMAFELSKGEIPSELMVRHQCDNEGCCNPKHLILGTHQNNMDDMTSRGRSARGERDHTAKLTEKDVLEIRSSSMSTNEIAERFGIHRRTVYEIRWRKRWRHV